MFAGAVVQVPLVNHVVARYIILRTGVSGSGAAMKFEVFGCPGNASSEGSRKLFILLHNYENHFTFLFCAL